MTRLVDDVEVAIQLQYAYRELLMNKQIISVTRPLQRLLLFAAMSFLAISLCGKALAEDPSPKTTKKESMFPARPVLGLPNSHSSTAGSLIVREGLLRFENTKQEVTLLSIASIEDILLSQQEKQVGGVPMMLGKGAVPFGGGRVVSLFSHKKYDEIAIVYRDDNGGIHGVIFELQAGQGLQLQESLVSQGARVATQALLGGRTEPEVDHASN